MYCYYPRERNHVCSYIFPLLKIWIRNYNYLPSFFPRTKFLSDDWMVARNFKEPEPAGELSKLWWWNLRVSALCLKAPLTIHPNVTIQETLSLLSREGYDQVPVVDDSG